MRFYAWHRAIDLFASSESFNKTWADQAFFAAHKRWDGFLVGGASLKPEICEIVKEIAVAKNTFAMGGA